MRRALYLIIFLLTSSALFGQGGMMPGPGTPRAAASGPVFIASAKSGPLVCVSAATSCPVTYSPTAGHPLLVGVNYGANAVTSVTDDGAAGGSTYAALFSQVSVNGGNNHLIIYCTPSAASGVTTITANGGGKSVVVLDFTGVGCAVDQSNLTENVTLASTNWTSGATPATTNAADVAIGFALDAVTQDSGWVGTGGYTCITGAWNAYDGVGNSLCYKVLSSTGAQTATGTITNAEAARAIIAVIH